MANAQQGQYQSRRDKARRHPEKGLSLGRKADHQAGDAGGKKRNGGDRIVHLAVALMRLQSSSG